MYCIVGAPTSRLGGGQPPSPGPGPSYRSTQDLAHVIHQIFIHFVKSVQVAIILPLATLFTHNSILQAFQLLCSNVNLLRYKFQFHETLMMFIAQNSLF